MLSVSFGIALYYWIAILKPTLLPGIEAFGWILPLVLFCFSLGCLMVVSRQRVALVGHIWTVSLCCFGFLLASSFIALTEPQDLALGQSTELDTESAIIEVELVGDPTRGSWGVFWPARMLVFCNEGVSTTASGSLRVFSSVDHNLWSGARLKGRGQLQEREGLWIFYLESLIDWEYASRWDWLRAQALDGAWEPLVAVCSRETAALCFGLVTGQEANFDPRDPGLFARGGMSHLLALSGMHVGIYLGLVFFLARIVRIGPWMRLFLSVTIVLVLLFFARSGASLSRAVLMTVFGAVVPRSMQRFWGPSRTLPLALIVLTLVDPQSLVSYGALYSFTIVWALTVYMPLLSRVLGSLGALLVIVAISSWPITWLLGGAVPIFGLILSVVAGPLVVMLLLLGIVWVVTGAILGIIPWIISPLSWFSEAGAWLLTSLAHEAGRGPVVQLDSLVAGIFFTSMVGLTLHFSSPRNGHGIQRSQLQFSPFNF